ncbi:MAG TPA: hypothetical protein VFR18_15385 [Terriglobia bacterium]|nr:hypothetical protein [Terriglobia bacterium]
MTLNLMLTSRDAVYLCADFRLTSTKDQVALADSYDTQKLIPVIRGDWSALIAYAGVASAPPLIDDVGQWIVDQVESIPHNGSLSELSSRLLKFDTRLGRILGDRRIAFSVVGFSDQRPFMMLLSNFVDTSGQVVNAGPQLRTYVRRSKSPEVRAVGTARPDVFERVRLERLLHASSSHASMAKLTRDAIAEINVSVARRSKGTISEECVVGYLLRTGSAVIGAHGIPAGAGCFPNWVRRDLQKGGVSGFEGTEMPIRWKGTTVRALDGNIVRIHEIADAGKPIFNASRPGSSCHVVPVNTTLRLFLGPEGTLRRMARFERNLRVAP